MSFKAFLENYRTKENDIPSHYGMDSYLGKYTIPEDKYDEFWALYKEEVFVKKRPVQLIEKHVESGPIVIDFDFRYTQNTKSRAYTQHFIESIIKIYHEVIQTVIDISDEEVPEAIQAFIFERPSPYLSRDVIKDGIHIMYPFIVTEPAVQLHIRDLVLKHPQLEATLNKIPLSHSMTPSQIIDRAVIYQNGWFLYGASKPKLEAYRLTRILDCHTRDCDINEYPNDKLPELLSIRNKTDCMPYRPEFEPQIKVHRDKILKKFPHLMGGDGAQGGGVFSNTMALLQSTKTDGAGQQWVSIPENPLHQAAQKQTAQPQIGIHDEEIQTIQDLVGMLSDERADNYEDWVRVGWTLYNIDASSTELFTIWDDFSRRSSKYQEGVCEREWVKMRPRGGLTIGSLHFWAQQDSPDEYGVLRDRDLRHWIMMSLSGTHVDVAKVLYRMYRYQYVCASVKFKSWYEFVGHRWKEIDNGIALRNRIPNELVNEYQKLRAIFYEKIQIETRSLQNLQLEAQAYQLQDQRPPAITNGNGKNGNGKSPVVAEAEAVKEITERIQRMRDDCAAIDQLVPKLKTTNFIDNVMKECSGIFYIGGFGNQLDSNPYLLGFENGVFELQSGHFRDGRPEDFISLSTGVHYQPYNPNTEYSQALMAFLTQLQPVQEDRDYLLTFLASCLEGSNADESLHIWTGRGGNGKSKINELYCNAVGGYAVKLPISLLTQKRAASNAANPELMDTKGKRFCYMEEPSEGEVLNVGFMKELTGGDKIKARGLYRDFMEFKPQFKMALLCNDLPKVPPFDEGTWRRLKVLEFKSRFVANPKAPNEYPRDKYLSEKLILWKESFIGLLLKYYEKYRRDGLIIPESVVRFTKEYQKGMDQYHEFIDAKLLYTGKKEDRIELNEVYQVFTQWFEENVQTHKVPSRRELKTYLEKKYTRQSVSPSFLVHFQWKEIDPDEEEAEEPEEPEGVN